MSGFSLLFMLCAVRACKERSGLMEVVMYLVPLALALGGLGLAAFLWSLKNGQYDDLDGAAWRAIADDEAADGRSP